MLDLFRHRALVEILVSRELKARYRGTVLGFLWSFTNPLLMMVTYDLIFRVYIRIEQEKYSAFLLCGLLPWMAFVGGITDGMSSLVNNSGLIRKVYLPLEIFPLVSVCTQMVHFCLSIPVLLLFMYANNIHLSIHILWLPLIVLLQATLCYALALLLASWVVQFRDLQHIIPNLLMIWFHITPILYPMHLVPASFAFIVRYNPMTWIIQSYRDIFFLQRSPQYLPLGLCALLAISLFLFSRYIFKQNAEIYPEMV